MPTLPGSCLLLLGCLFPQTASPEQPDTVPDAIEESEFLDWVRDSALPVEQLERNDALEQYLDQALEGRRIVYIGEPGHFYTEKYAVQLLLIRHLVQRGYRHIFQEGLGASMAQAFDDFVQTGQRPGQGRPSGVSEDQVRYQQRAFEGWSGAKTPEFQRRVSAERSRFFEQIHQLNRSLPEGSAPIRVHPLDIDMLPGGCYHGITQLLDQYASVPEARLLRALAEKQAGETRQEEVARLERLREAVEQHPVGQLDFLTAPHRSQLQKLSDCLVESIVFLETARTDGKLDRALVRREPAMFRQVQYVLEQLPADEGVIMIAHTNHLSKIGSDTLRARDPSVGELIDQAYPGQVFSIGTRPAR